MCLLCGVLKCSSVPASLLLVTGAELLPVIAWLGHRGADACCVHCFGIYAPGPVTGHVGEAIVRCCWHSTALASAVLTTGPDHAASCQQRTLLLDTE